MQNLLFFSFFFTAICFAQETAAPRAVQVEQEASIVNDDGVRVSVLGYHDFSSTEKETAMRISTTKFRKQMQTIKDMGLPVITMADFCAWKRGEKMIPAKSVLITIDDGWKSVYTDAYPILKEFGYPFTVFLYKRYVNVQGKSMTYAMIQEMQKNGATIGSHSVSHPYPATVKSNKRKGPTAYEKFLNTELGDSKIFLEEKFTQAINTYAYPGGFHTDEMFPIASKLGYKHLFTVLPGKVKRSTNDFTLPRYIILGNYDNYFVLATEFRDASGTPTELVQKTPYPVEPEAGALINSRLPKISADLSTVIDIRPETLTMKVGGFGEVPASFDPISKQLSWQVNRKLRGEDCQVSVSWKDAKGKSIDTPLRWSFRIDKEAAYQPDATD